MHQALYRKWRPRTFGDVCGQEHVTSVLRHEVMTKTTSHAYLFCGSRGTGKTTCAKILARAVSCENPRDGDPCGECASCKAAQSQSCIDIVEMDAASNNGVDDIRTIRDEVEYLPAELKYKVYIIDEVHMLTPSAFNALLKTLEEPPPHVIFILATTELNKIPATILSRCQRFDFRRISSDVIASRLETIAAAENIQLDHEAAFMIAHLAEGGMRDAISLLELCAGEARPIDEELVEEVAGTGGRDAVIRLCEGVASRDYDAIFAEIDKIYRSSRDLTVFWQDVIGFWRDMLVVKTTRGGAEYLDLTERQYNELARVAERFSTETIIYHAKLLDSTLETLRRASSSKRVIAEMTLVRMCDERFSPTNEAVLSRIAALENKFKSGTLSASPSDSPSAPMSESLSADAARSTAQTQSASSQPPQAQSQSPQAQSQSSQPSLTEPAAPIKKEYRQLPYWADFVQKCTERDPMLGSFMRETAKGYTVNTDGYVHIRTNNQAAQAIITRMFSTLLETLNEFSDQPLTSDSVKLEYVPERRDDKQRELDELARTLDSSPET